MYTRINVLFIRKLFSYLENNGNSKCNCTTIQRMLNCNYILVAVLAIKTKLSTQNMQYIYIRDVGIK